GGGRPKPALAALEQATAAAVGMERRSARSLTGRSVVEILQRAHGRHCSRAVKSRGEDGNFPPRRLHDRTRLGQRGGTCRSAYAPPPDTTTETRAPETPRAKTAISRSQFWLWWLCERGSASGGHWQ